MAHIRGPYFSRAKVAPSFPPFFRRCQSDLSERPRTNRRPRTKSDGIMGYSDGGTDSRRDETLFNIIPTRIGKLRKGHLSSPLCPEVASFVFTMLGHSQIRLCGIACLESPLPPSGNQANFRAVTEPSRAALKLSFCHMQILIGTSNPKLCAEHRRRGSRWGIV